MILLISIKFCAKVQLCETNSTIAWCWHCYLIFYFNFDFANLFIVVGKKNETAGIELLLCFIVVESGLRIRLKYYPDPDLTLEKKTESDHILKNRIRIRPYFKSQIRISIRPTHPDTDPQPFLHCIECNLLNLFFFFFALILNLVLLIVDSIN